jgi:hypothetical protein
MSSFHSGAGSGGLIHIYVCGDDNFHGVIEARGGLTVKFPDWIPRTMSAAYYQNSLGNLGGSNFSNYRSFQQITSASNGIIFRNSHTTGGYVSPSYLSACVANASSLFYPSSEKKIQLNYLRVSSWNMTALMSETTPFVNTLKLAIQHSSQSGVIPDLTVYPTVIDLPSTFGVDTLEVNTLICEAAKLNITGAGYLKLINLYGDRSCIITIADEVILKTARDFVVDSFHLWFLGSSRLEGGNSLTIQNHGKIYWMNYANNNLTAIPTTLTEFLTTMRNISFRTLTVRKNSGLYGAVVFINSEEIYVQQNSVISASGLGFEGGKASRKDSPIDGRGKGFGAKGSLGGDGGSYGGSGAKGITNLYNQINADQHLDLNNTDINLVMSNPLYPTTYGDPYSPFELGSGGGACYKNELCFGGHGGGVVYIHAGDNVYVDATSSITADGEDTYLGGGGGSGGSIWIRHRPFGTAVVELPSPKIVYNGHIIGGGSITANGGTTCSTIGCVTNIDQTGGAGGGGRIRIEKVLSKFTGILQARSGFQNESTQLFETARSGTVVRVPAISTLLLNKTSNGTACLDVLFIHHPVFPTQTITSSGHGTGNRNALNADDAVIKGYWTIGYRARIASDHLLSSQATASEVKRALQSLEYEELDKISVKRRPSLLSGWIWSITFHHTSIDRVVPVTVERKYLWCTSGQPQLTVSTNSNFYLPVDEEYFTTEDAPANYSSNELSELMEFSQNNILTAHSTAVWMNGNRLRVIPNNSLIHDYEPLVEELYLTKLFVVPRFEGRMLSLSPPYLKSNYEPDWNYPSSVPSGLPSGQPSRQPSGFPSAQPTGQPSSQPSSQPTSQPSGFPSAQPSSLPSGKPSTQPSSKPSGLPSSQPSSLPSGQPTTQPSGFPTSQPTSLPSMQPSTQPSSLPSAQPASKPTGQPTTQPSSQPSLQPFGRPTGQPSRQPSSQPSKQPFSFPTSQPSSQPISRPSGQPSSQPSMQPSAQPAGAPTSIPSCQPTSLPTCQPTTQPSSQPTSQPISFPTMQPSSQPSSLPSLQPFAHPTSLPSNQPTSKPTNQPSTQPSGFPTLQPFAAPTSTPSVQPSSLPTGQPNAYPSIIPSGQPSSLPTKQPTTQPTSFPTQQPASVPTSIPSTQPSGYPTMQPTSLPSGLPSSQPSSNPTQPSSQPSSQPTNPTSKIILFVFLSPVLL